MFSCGLHVERIIFLTCRVKQNGLLELILLASFQFFNEVTDRFKIINIKLYWTICRLFEMYSFSDFLGGA